MLHSALSTRANAVNPAIYGVVNLFTVKQGQTVAIILNILDAALHPFHLHGKQLQVIARPASGAGEYSGDEKPTLPAVPMRRDTVSVNGDSHVVLRFTTDNPGVL
jgi:iron transport multicopper oxidase